MRVVESAALLVVFTLVPGSLRAQTDIQADRKVFAGGSVMKYGPAAFGGLEMAMNRWLAIRAEGMASLQQRNDWPDRFFGSVSLSGIATFRADTRLAPYVFAGGAYSMSRHLAPGLGPLGGAGLRFRFGAVQPFVEVRAQHRIGAPLSIGLRF
jgi:hypothetical protein